VKNNSDNDIYFVRVNLKKVSWRQHSRKHDENQPAYTKSVWQDEPLPSARLKPMDDGDALKDLRLQAGKAATFEVEPRISALYYEVLVSFC
jgi:hypothetical protein